MKTLAKLTVIALAVVVIYHAVAGAACLYFTAPVVHNSDECDVLQTQFGRTWCMNLIKSDEAAKL